MFDEDAEIHIKESSSGKYTSITAKQVAMDVDSITNIYVKANEIPGIIFL
jgi:putative lipoic acid-binding regulatory protein